MFNRKSKKNIKESHNEMFKTGSNLDFITSESYKLLRTNIMFSFTDTNRKRVIGITSSVKGEGKSTTSINLAYSLAEAGNRVLLIEADLRKPVIAKKLGIKSSPGLSNLLVGLNTGDEAVQRGVVLDNLDVMTAGKVPPNASELLSSREMEYTVEKLSEIYDYVILDLPPVVEVADALIVSKLTGGMIVVVRQDYVKKSELSETMRQLEYVKAKVLGFVLNGVKGSSGTYMKGYYKP